MARERRRRTPLVYFALGAGAAALVAWALWPSGSGEHVAAVVEPPAPASQPPPHALPKSAAEGEAPAQASTTPTVWAALPRASDAGLSVATQGPADAGAVDPSRPVQNASATKPQPAATPAVQHVGDVAIVQGAPGTSRTSRTADVRGRVLWSGPSSLPPIPSGVDVAVCGYQRPDPSLVTARGGIGNILVKTTGVRRAFTDPGAVLNIDGCQFTEHAQIAQDQRVVVNNHDGLDWAIVAHREHAPASEDLSIEVPRYVQNISVLLPRNGTWVFTERRHPWMRAYVIWDGTVDTAVTSPDGSFALDYLQPGPHRFVLQREPYDGKSSVVKSFDLDLVAGQSFELEEPLAPPSH